MSRRALERKKAAMQNHGTPGFSGLRLIFIFLFFSLEKFGTTKNEKKNWAKKVFFENFSFVLKRLPLVGKILHLLITVLHNC